MRLPVGTIDHSATRALLARVGGIDCDNGNSGQPRFVLNKAAKLAETPRVQTAALALFGPNATADVGQIFDRNPQSLAFSPRNKFLADTVVHVFAKIGFLLGQLAKPTFGRLGSPALQSGLALGDLGAKRLDRGASVAVTLTVECDVDDAEIDTQYAFDVDQCRVRHVADAGDIPLALDQHQVDFALAERQQLALSFAADVGHALAAGQRPDRDVIVTLEAKNSIIERLRRVAAKRHRLRRPAVGFVGDVGVGDLGDAANGHLCRYAEPFTRRMVRRLVQVELPNSASRKTNFGHPIAGFIAALKRRQKQLGLLFRRLDLDVRNQFHRFHIGTMRAMRQELFNSLGAIGPLAAETAIPLRPEGRSISRRNR